MKVPKWKLAVLVFLNVLIACSAQEYTGEEVDDEVVVDQGIEPDPGKCYELFLAKFNFHKQIVQ